MTTNIWNEDYEKLLNSIRLNSVIMSKYHKKKYYKFKSYLKYFRIPIIILSSCNSVFAVSNFIPKDDISTVTCLISLSCGILGSIELFLQIQQTMENSLTNSKDFYNLSIDIYKMLNLIREHRPCSQEAYLDKTYNIYCKIIEKGNPLKSKILDHLSNLDIEGIVPINKSIEKKSSFLNFFPITPISSLLPTPTPIPTPIPTPTPNPTLSLIIPNNFK